MGNAWLGPKGRVTSRQRTGPRHAPPINVWTARVCVVIPCRNEAAHIALTLSALMRQTFPHDRTTIFVVDAMSIDGTRQIVADYDRLYRNIHVLDNPSGQTPRALNIGIEAASADILVRVDAHCMIAPDYISRCVELLCQTRAGNVGGPMRPTAHQRLGHAIASALCSPLGIGNGRFHYLERLEAVDTVYLGAFPLAVLREVNGYDEELIRNQDDELNFRIRRAGYQVVLSPDIVSSYTPRTTHGALWRQYYQYGYWKVRVIRKHPRSAQPKHLVPATTAAGLTASFPAYDLFQQVWMLSPWLGYLSFVVLASIHLGRQKPTTIPILLTVLPCLHLSYGFGFLAGMTRLGLSELGIMRLPGRSDEAESRWLIDGELPPSQTMED